MAKFSAGRSGNARGRPRGAVGKAGKFRQALEKDASAVLAAVIAAARGGDMQAARMVMDRVVPPLRPVDVPISVAVDGSADLAGQARAIFAATLGAQIAPVAAVGLLGALAAAAKVIEQTELEQRIRALEMAQKGNHGNDK